MNNFLWLDLETTGLDPWHDLPLQIGVARADDKGRITSSAEWVIGWPKATLDARLTPFVRDMHTKNGLLDRVGKSSASLLSVERELIQFIGEGKPYLAGSSIHFDRSFLASWFRPVLGVLHYRMLDITSLKLAGEAFGLPPMPKADPKHLVMDDIRDSIAEFYCWGASVAEFLR